VAPLNDCPYRYHGGKLPKVPIRKVTAATSAVNAVFLSDQIDTSAITPQMEEAFKLAFSDVALRTTLAERYAELEEESVSGFLSALKGKHFEVIVRDRFNAGVGTGDLVPGLGQRAELAPDPIQPGWDLRILNPDGSTNELLQLKATDSLKPIRDALEKYPEFHVLSTDEGAQQAVDALLSRENVLHSGISDTQLEADVAAPAEDLLDSPLENLTEAVIPGLPFVIITLTEGTRVLMGRQAFHQAMNRSLERATKTGAAIGVGAVAALAGAEFLSLPATFFTRIGVDRYTIYRGLLRRLQADARSIKDLQAPGTR